MANSWNWRIREFNTADAAYVERMFARDDPSFRYAGQCRQLGCGKMAECFVLYDYVSGGRGRTSTSQKQFCRRHADEKMARVPVGQHA